MIKFKSHLYYEEKDELQENLKSLKPLVGSKITYFLNGKSLGVAFTDIYRGEYHPAVGLYKQARVYLLTCLLVVVDASAPVGAVKGEYLDGVQLLSRLRCNSCIQ